MESSGLPAAAHDGDGPATASSGATSGAGCRCPNARQERGGASPARGEGVPIANRGGTLVEKKRNFLGLFVKYNLVGPDR
jgi:hypothetical protein